MRTLKNTFGIAAVGVTAAACGGALEPTDGGEITRAGVVAEAETMPLSTNTPQMRRLVIQNAWKFDADTLKIECWSDEPGLAFLYTAQLPDGQRIGASGAFTDGAFMVPREGTFGTAAEIPDVVEDARLSGRVDIAARRVCGSGEGWGE